MIHKYFLYILLLISQITFGQGKDYNFININNKNGLSSNSVNTILKDKNGFMWFGTDDGLNKFDGQNFVVYRHSETDSTSIGRGIVMAMQEDKNGNLWIGTNVTLSLYNRSLNNFINFDFRKFGWIRSLDTDHLGNIWVATHTGLHYFNPKTKKIISYRANPSRNDKLNSDVILSVFEDSKNRVWVGTNAGFHLLNSQNGKFTRFFHDKNNFYSISNGIVRSIVEDKAGNIWLGTGSGLDKMNVKTQTFENFKSVKSDEQTLSDNNIYKISFDKENKLWVGTEDGLNIFDPSNGKTTRIDKSVSTNYSGIGSFEGHSIRDIYLDNCGIYWIGTKQRGVNKYDTNLAFFNHKKLNYIDREGFSAGSVFSFAESSSGEIFIGTDDKGLNIFNKKTGLLKPIPLLGMEAQKGIILTLERSENTLWIGTYLYGIYVMDLSTKAVRNIRIPKSNTDVTNTPVNCLRADKQGNIWIGTNGKGLYKYHIKTGELSHFSQIFLKKEVENILFTGYISAIEEDLQGNLWIGTNGSGIQGHWSINSNNLKDIEDAIIEFSQLGIKVAFTELDYTVLPNPWDLKGADVNQRFDENPKMNPYKDSLPDSVQTALANRYIDLFKLFLKHRDKISRVTFWGVDDSHSWLNGFPIRNRTNYPLLFDRALEPKKAYQAVLNLKSGK